MDNKFAEKIGVDAFFEFRLDAYFVFCISEDGRFGVLVKAESLGIEWIRCLPEVFNCRFSNSASSNWTLKTKRGAMNCATTNAFVIRSDLQGFPPTRRQILSFSTLR